MRSRFLALLLVLALWPAAGETVELALHLVEHGDLAHGPTDEHAGVPLGADEHGCSGLFHLCASGNAGITSSPRLAWAVTAPDGVAVPAIAAPLERAGCGAPTPPIRPPIA